MKKSPRRRIRLTSGQAHTVVLANAIEESGAAANVLTPETLEAVGLKTAHALGETGDPARFLVRRAEEIVKIARDAGIRTSFPTQLRAGGWMNGLLAAAAFCCGALTDRFTGSEGTVNLLSAPFWGVILWNLAVYVFLLFSACVSVAGKDFSSPSLRKLTCSVLEWVSFFSLRRGSLKSRFCSSWARVIAPLTRLAAARALHLAAAAFALGLITSISIRGIGTSYSAVWESTWLADEPETVLTFLDWTYGLVPALPGISAIPDIETLKLMRSDQLPFLSEGFSAGPWLLRMMVIVTATVIVPRLLLAFLCWLRMIYFRGHVPVPFDTKTFATVTTGRTGETLNGGIAFASLQALSEETGRSVRAILDLAGSRGNEWLITASEGGQVELPEGARTAAVFFEGTSVPEDEQETLFEAIRSVAEKSGIRLAAAIDMTGFESRMSPYPERVTERMTVWRNFASSHGAAAVFFTDDPASQLAAARTLQDLAPGVTENNNDA